MKRASAPLAGLFGFLACLVVAAPGVAGQETALASVLDEHRGKHNVVIVLATSRDEPRVFDFHLDLSTRWNAVTRRDITVIDVIPPGRDVEAVARRFSVVDQDFAIIVLDKSGDVLHKSTDPGSLPEILALIDLSTEQDT